MRRSNFYLILALSFLFLGSTITACSEKSEKKTTSSSRSKRSKKKKKKKKSREELIIGSWSLDDMEFDEPNLTDDIRKMMDDMIDELRGKWKFEFRTDGTYTMTGTGFGDGDGKFELKESGTVILLIQGNNGLPEENKIEILNEKTLIIVREESSTSYKMILSREF